MKIFRRSNDRCIFVMRSYLLENSDLQTKLKNGYRIFGDYLIGFAIIRNVQFKHTDSIGVDLRIAFNCEYIYDIFRDGTSKICKDRYGVGYPPNNESVNKIISACREICEHLVAYDYLVEKYNRQIANDAIYLTGSYYNYSYDLDYIEHLSTHIRYGEIISDECQTEIEERFPEKLI